MLRPHNQVESNHTTQSLVTHCTDNLFGINDPYQPQFHVNRWATGPRELKTPGQGSISAIAIFGQPSSCGLENSIIFIDLSHFAVVGFCSTD